MYLEMGQEYLSSLLYSTEYFNAAATDGWEALLRASSAAWGDPEVGSVTGDYFTLESMVSALSTAVWNGLFYSCSTTYGIHIGDT